MARLCRLLMEVVEEMAGLEVIQQLEDSLPTQIVAWAVGVAGLSSQVRQTMADQEALRSLM